MKRASRIACGALAAGAVVLGGATSASAAHLAGSLVGSHARGSQSSAKVTISFMETMVSGTQKPTLATLVSRFEKANPNVTVQLVGEPNYGVLEQKEEAAVAAGNPPTMGQVYEDWAASFASSKAIVPLTSYINGSDGVSAAARDEIWAGVLKDCYLPDGQIWMWPFNKSDYILYYNPSLLEKAGAAAPATWAQLATVAKKVTTGKDWATSIDPGTASSPANGTYTYLSLVEAYGGSWVKNGKPNFDSPAAVQAMTYLQTLDKEGALKLGTNYPEQTALGSGYAAIAVSTVASYPYMVDAVGNKFPMQVEAMPSGPAGQGNALEGTNLAIFSKATAAQKAAAWSFMKWLSEPAQTAYWAEETGYLPVTKAALPLMTSYDASHPYQKIAAESLAYATPTPPYGWWDEAVGEVADALQSVLVSGASPASALKSAQQAALGDVNQ